MLRFEGIDIVKNSLGYCLVRCFIGCLLSKAGIIGMANRWDVNYQYHIHRSGWTGFRFEINTNREHGCFKVDHTSLLIVTFTLSLCLGASCMRRRSYITYRCGYRSTNCHLIVGQ